VSISSGEMMREKQIYFLASDLLKEVPTHLNMEEVSIKYSQKYKDSTNTVLG
jgi:hypothetical protein